MERKKRKRPREKTEKFLKVLLDRAVAKGKKP